MFIFVHRGDAQVHQWAVEHESRAVVHQPAVGRFQELCQVRLRRRPSSSSLGTYSPTAIWTCGPLQIHTVTSSRVCSFVWEIIFWRNVESLHLNNNESWGFQYHITTLFYLNVSGKSFCLIVAYCDLSLN